jgi:predicted phosphodiesterase
MKQEFRFQYFSDIHLEFYHENIPKIKRIFLESLSKQRNRPPFLLIPGDIGKPSNPSYTEFIKTISPLYEKVFITTGNHEYYKMTFSTTTELDNYCREVCRSVPKHNVIFLQNEVVQLSEDIPISIFGGTFWTDIPKLKINTISQSINDYKLIPNFTPALSTSLHKQAVSTLQSHINSLPEDMNLIVMSHHMPSMSLINPKYRGLSGNNDINHAFASDITIAKDSKINAWVYGHTHSPLQEGKFYCNPIGYPGENRKWSLDTQFTIFV